MVECVIQPFEGISVGGRGDVRFTAEQHEVEKVLGKGNLTTYAVEDVLRYTNEDIALAFTFIKGKCETIEFMDARSRPPTLFGLPLAGPTMRATAEMLVGRGLTPYNEHGLISDLVAVVTPPSQDEGYAGGPDTIWFPEIGTCLWTSLETSTGYGEPDLGEFVLDTVSIWPRGHSPQLVL